MKLKIRGFSKNAVEEAERMLVRLLPLEDSANHTTDTQKLEAAKDSSYLVPILQEASPADHTFRGVDLGRWTLPITPAVRSQLQRKFNERTEEFGQEATIRQDLINRFVTSIQLHADEVFIPTAEVGNWTPDPEYKLSAEIGQLLFPLENRKANKASEKMTRASSPTLFSTSFPGLSSLLTSPHFSATARMQSPSLLYDFIAAPEQEDFEPGQKLPTLHIQMRTGLNGAKATLHKLSLGFRQHVHDILLPDQAADVRFFRYGRLRFRKSHHDKNVREWTGAVVANIESGARLDAPSLRIEVPEWTIPGYPMDAKGMRPVTYLFSGIQFRQTVTGAFAGTDVSYSSLQTGKLGAKGGVLSLFYGGGKEASKEVGKRVGKRASKGAGDVMLQDEISLKAFARKCFALVDRVTEASAQTSPVSKVPIPRDEQSESEIKRPGQQVAADSSISTGGDRLDRAIRNFEGQQELDRKEVDHVLRGTASAEETHTNNTIGPWAMAGHTNVLTSDIPKASSTSPTAEEESRIDEAKDAKA